MTYYFSLATVSRLSGVPDKRLRHLTQRLPFTPLRRAGRTDLYSAQDARIMVICARLQGTLNRQALVDFFHWIRERPEWPYFQSFDFSHDGVAIHVPTKRWLEGVAAAEYDDA